MASFKEEGDKLYKQLRYEDAITSYTREIQNCFQPENSDIYLAYSNRCACYLQINDLRNALADAEFCIKLKPNWSKGYSRKGACLARLNRKKEAILAFEYVLKIDKTNADATREILKLREQTQTTNDYGIQSNNMNISKLLIYIHSLWTNLVILLTRLYEICVFWWTSLNDDTKTYLQIGAIVIAIYYFFFSSPRSTYYPEEAGYFGDSSYSGGMYGSSYGGGMSYTMWGLIMLGAYKLPPLFPEVLGDHARPFFGMSWTTFMWLLSMFNRNASSFGHRGVGDLFGNRGYRRY